MSEGGRLREALILWLADTYEGAYQYATVEPDFDWDVDALLALPELAAVLAKADAADRVEATVARSEELRYPTVSTAVLRRRLDGTDREDRGRC